MSTFKPDWDELEAARESIREHMIVTRKYQVRLDELIRSLRKITVESTNVGTVILIEKLCKKAEKQND